MLERLGTTLMEEGGDDEAAQVCRDLVVQDERRESSWALLALSLYRCGRTPDALGVIDGARRVLRTEIRHGSRPGPRYDRAANPRPR